MTQGETNNQKIARDIHRQLGGTRFDLMTGSYNFLAIENGLEFKIRRNSSRANWLEIKLNGLDLYDVKFLRVTGGKMDKKTWEFIPIKTVVVKEFNDVYNDMLQDIFTETTGLYTKF